MKGGELAGGAGKEKPGMCRVKRDKERRRAKLDL